MSAKGAEAPEGGLDAIRAALLHPRDLEAFEGTLRAEEEIGGPSESFLRVWQAIARLSAKDLWGRYEHWARVDYLNRLIELGRPLPPGKTLEEVLAGRRGRG